MAGCRCPGDDCTPSHEQKRLDSFFDTVLDSFAGDRDADMASRKVVWAHEADLHVLDDAHVRVAARAFAARWTPGEFMAWGQFLEEPERMALLAGRDAPWLVRMVRRLDHWIWLSELPKALPAAVRQELFALACRDRYWISELVELLGRRARDMVWLREEIDRHPDAGVKSAFRDHLGAESIPKRDMSLVLLRIGV